jgi:hypothetical protein
MIDVLRLRFLSGQPGQKGADGVNGVNGADGAPGSAGPPGTPGTGFASIAQNLQTGAYAVVAGDAGKVVVMNAASAVTLSLTAAAILGTGFAFLVRAEGAGAVTIDPNGSETINGATTLILYQGDGALVWTDGANWRANVGYKPRSKVIAFTRDVTAASAAAVPYTGVGFQPTSIQFIAGAPTTSGMAGWGLADEALGKGSVAANQGFTGLFGTGSYNLLLGTTTIGQGAVVTAYTADGFTMDWTKFGAPAALTVNIYALCRR